jgi:hypothetical protein
VHLPRYHVNDGDARAKLSIVTHIWKEKLTTFGTANLTPREVVLVRVASFTFRFTTTKQLRDCIEYYERKTHPSSRVSAKAIAADIGPDWRKLLLWEVERWFERLPIYRHTCLKSRNAESTERPPQDPNPRGNGKPLTISEIPMFRQLRL